jgi:hypothetical protein
MDAALPLRTEMSPAPLELFSVIERPRRDHVSEIIDEHIQALQLKLDSSIARILHRETGSI